MEWINGETRESKWRRKKEYLSNWHKWFAWYPVIIGYVESEGKVRRKKAWLQYVFRDGYYDPYFTKWTFHYRSQNETVEEYNKRRSGL